MDILLTHGHFLHEDAHELKVMKPYPPLGILHLSAYLKQRGFHARVYDATFGSLAEYKTLLEHEHPAAVGIYGTLMTKFSVLEMLQLAKAAGSVVILGGPEPVNYLNEYLDLGADVIVLGEGEMVLEDLLPVLATSGCHALERISGIAFRRENGSVFRTAPRPLIEDLDSLPDPDRDAVDIDEYLGVWRAHHGMGSVSVICARGCPYHCTWCSRAVYGNTHRRRSPRRVASEVEHILARYKPDQLWYADDVFTIHHPWFFEYAAELKRRGIRVPFECISRADRLNEEVIDQLSEMGCCRLWLGSESGSQRILDAMRRGVKIEQVRSVARALKRRGIQTGMFVMLGYEGEDTNDLKATLDLITECAPDSFLTTVAYPIRGTEYYETVHERILDGAFWELRTDRDLGVRGRHSRRFYSFATRWIVNSVALQRERNTGPHLFRLAKAAAATLVGRLGMVMTHREVDRGARGSRRDRQGAVRS
ncbi:MAG: B12-binding domain-containing radical SAM protein [Acidobacteriia bacterium]|nr:B12-binding domain-containing radical SAM protein [Terriglobia bacterium]